MRSERSHSILYSRSRRLFMKDCRSYDSAMASNRSAFLVRMFTDARQNGATLIFWLSLTKLSCLMGVSGTPGKLSWRGKKRWV